jgi:hypothetical protein
MSNVYVTEQIVQVTVNGQESSLSDTNAPVTVNLTEQIVLVENSEVGPQGIAGPANVLQVGTVTTGAEGSNVSATITGTTPAQTLNLSIPRGNTGAPSSVDVGTTTTGAPGSSAEVTNSGTTSDAIFDFVVPEGIQGEAATIAIGDVDTVDWDEPATVVNTGTSGDAVFDFEIPQGRNATIAVGTTTTGDPGDPATVTNSGTSQDAVFNFVVPEGIQGEAATVAVGTTTTGSPGTSASVTNSGTSADAVFNFVVPEGVKGDKGDTGDTGADITDLVADLDANGFKLTNVGAPVAADDAATKAYVDGVAEGIITKPAVLAATTTNLTATYNNGTAGVGATLTATSNGVWPGVDGVTTGWVQFAGILVKDQTNAEENGRYVLFNLGSSTTPWVLRRCGLCDEPDEIPGMYIFVQEGTQGGNGYVALVSDPSTFVVGTDDIVFSQFSGAGQIEAGVGLTKTGNTIDLDNTAVTPGSYTLSAITVDQQGRITAAASGSVPSGIVTTADNGTVTSTMIQNNTIVDEDINASAAIAATKVQGTTPSGGSANQVLKKVDGADYNTTWGTIAGAVYQASAPSSPQTGDVWVDSDAVAGVLNQNDYLLKADAEAPSGYLLKTDATANYYTKTESNNRYPTKVVAGSGVYSAGGLLTTTYENFVSFNLVCTGRPVLVNFSITFNNSNSGANRQVKVKANLDGTIIGHEITDLTALLISGSSSVATSAHSFIVTPSAGTRSFTLQVAASANSSCGLNRASMTAVELGT